MDNYIVVDNLCKTYMTDKNSVEALKNITFTLPNAGMIFVIGKSGCGKSTLLNILGGLDNPTGGNLYIDGKQVDFSNEKNLDAYRNEDIGFVFQDHNLMDNFNIKDNIKMSLVTQNKEVSDGEIDEILKLVDLEDVKTKMPNEVSGGQRQRISIARTLIKKPKIMLADEPTGNLDSSNSKRIFEILKDLSKNNLVLVITHDLDSAYVYGDRIIELKDGKLINDLVKTNDFDLKKLKENYTKEVEKSFSKNKNRLVAPTLQEKSKRETTSKLTLKNAMHIMLTWLRRSKVSIIISILILAIALGGFGVVNTITRFNYYSALSKTLASTNACCAMVLKGSIDTEKYQLNFSGDTFSYEEYNEISEKFKDVYKAFPFSFTFSKYVDAWDERYQNQINGILELNEDLENGLKNFYNSSLIVGEMPSDNNFAIEILISDYLADSILNFGTTFSGVTVYPNSSYEKLLNNTFVDGIITYKIVGIYKSEYSDLYKQKYDEVKENKSYIFAKQYIYPVAITNSNAIKNYAFNSLLFKSSLNLKADGDLVFFNYESVMIGANTKQEVNELVASYSSDIVWAEDYTSDTISNSNIIISYSKYLEIFDRYEFDTNGNMLSDYSNLSDSDLNNLTIIEQIDENTNNEYKVVGVFRDIPMVSNLFITNKVVKNDHIEKGVVISNLVVSLKTNRVDGVVKYFQNTDMIINTVATERLLYFNGLFDITKDVMNMVVIVLLVFVTILMFSVISKNIREKQKDIGILRSLGANRKDITKIFLLNDLFYVICSFALALIIYFIGSMVVNNLLCANLKAELALLIINPVSILFMLAINLIVILLSSINPILKYTRMAPIDVIRNLDVD